MSDIEKCDCEILFYLRLGYAELELRTWTQACQFSKFIVFIARLGDKRHLFNTFEYKSMKHLSVEAVAAIEGRVLCPEQY